MVQVSSTWFPLIDRNPQKFVPNIFEAEGRGLPAGAAAGVAVAEVRVRYHFGDTPRWPAEVVAEKPGSRWHFSGSDFD